LKTATDIIFNTIFCKQIFKYFIKNKCFKLNEKKKMLNGELYHAGLDLRLLTERQRCKHLCHQLNSTSPHFMRARNKLITKIIGQIGKSFLIEQPFMCDYGYNIEIGENFCSNHNLLILDSAKVTIGDNVLIGPNCSFYTSTHPINYKERKLGTELAKPIKIGNNVWLGGNVVVLAGVSIGDNSVIGAGSVVSKDIPPNTVAVGNPCRVIKNIND
jgi:acetyltransferase-like isoleucine patch superfamily enzyme